MNTHVRLPRSVAAVFGNLPSRVPSAILRAGGRIRADADPKTLLANLQAAVDDFKARNTTRIDKIEAEVDRLVNGAVAGQLGAGQLGADRPVDLEYTKLFASYFRTGAEDGPLREANASGTRAQIRAAMSVGSPGDGGYMAPVEWDRTISRKLLPLSAMRQACTIRTTGVAGYRVVWSVNGFGSGWAGETASRPATSTPSFYTFDFVPGELFAFPQITQILLEDADFKIEDWLADEVAAAFAAQENIAFTAGDGVNKPFGFLTYITGQANAAKHPGGDIKVLPSGAAAGITSDALSDLVYSLKAPYRNPSCRWMMNSTTAGAVAKLKDGQGNYLWRDAYIAGQPQTLLGYPIVANEDMPDVAAGNTPIAFGDWQKGYIINDRTGTNTLRDPYTNKPFVGFYTRKRVGGGVADPNAIKVMKIAAS